MYRVTLTTILVTVGVAALLLGGCGRDATDAGAKLIGVGFDPGQVQPAAIPSGGLVDFVNMNYASTNLDLGATGLYYAGDAFVDGSDSFNLVMGFSYVFHPALETADELQLVSPKGPDVINSCYVTKSRTGPIGSFTTVDMGDALQLVGPTASYSIARNPGDYPGNTADVFTYYAEAATRVMGNPDMGNNWAYDEEMELRWDGGVPPPAAPVASIPQPSWAPDSRTGKGEGSPTIWSPPLLSSIQVGTTDEQTGGMPMEFVATDEYLPSPLSGEGDVVHVFWEPWDDAEAHSGRVVLQIRLLKREDDGDLLACPWDPSLNCECVDDSGDGVGPVDLWCDPDFQPDDTVGNNEGDSTNVDNCNDGIDNDGDFYCDTDGCICDNSNGFNCPRWMEGMWLGPDPECARHYKVRECREVGGEKRCFNKGGDRDPDGVAAELTCTVEDEPGHFKIDEDDIEKLIDEVDGSNIGGAMLIVARVVEERVTMPAVKDNIGNVVDIGDLRVRVSNISYGRLEVPPEGL